MPVRKILLSGLNLGMIVFLFLGQPVRSLAEKSPGVSAAIGQTLGEALSDGKIGSWEQVETQAQAVADAARLVRNFSLHEEFSPDGRLIGRERLDGTRETIRYDNQHERIAVWVTSADGKFKEERLYVQNNLRAILYVDGSMKTFQYLGPEIDFNRSGPPAPAQPAVCAIVATAAKVNILFYDSQGKLVNGFLPDGTVIMKQSEFEANDLNRVVNIDELQFLPK